jgi:glycosyltransferase involved in cell wall biosynthesis
VYGYDAHQRYFREEIRPRCDRRKRFIGAAGLRRKRRLLTSARCLLVPSLAPETSSLVAMEAAMCGTPTVAFRSGALPEIVEDGVTGFLVGDVKEMAEAIGKCDGIDRAQCREVAVSRFSEQQTAASYLRMYERLVAL